MINPWMISTGILTVALFVTARYMFKFARIIIRMQEAVEVSLDTLDEKYQTMSQVLEKPVFFDSIEVRQVISDISDSRDSILFIANQLGSVEMTQVEQSGEVDSHLEI